MSNHRLDDDELREFMARLEREFQARAQAPDDVEPSPGGQAIEMAQRSPKHVRLTLPLSRPRLVYALLAVNAIMYVLTGLIANGIRLPYEDVVGNQYIDRFTAALSILGAKENGLINAGHWWRLLTPMVLHGSLMHLLFNSMALYSLGTEAERVYGTARFTAVYALAGLAGSIASYVFNSDALSVGASGAIFGLFGALAAFAFTSRSLIGWEASKMQLGQMATLVVVNLIFGFLPGTNIDNSAHIGGLIVGGVVSLGLAPRYVVDRRGYLPVLERRDSPLAGWGLAAVLFVGLVISFLVAHPA